MVVLCEGCETKFHLADGQVPAKGARVRCSKCHHRFFVKPPEPGETRAQNSSPGAPAAPAEEPDLENPEFLFESNRATSSPGDAAPRPEPDEKESEPDEKESEPFADESFERGPTSFAEEAPSEPPADPPAEGEFSHDGSVSGRAVEQDAEAEAAYAQTRIVEPPEPAPSRPSVGSADMTGPALTDDPDEDDVFGDAEIPTSFHIGGETGSSDESEAPALDSVASAPAAAQCDDPDEGADLGSDGDMFGFDDDEPLSGSDPEVAEEADDADDLFGDSSQSLGGSWDEDDATDPLQSIDSGVEAEPGPSDEPLLDASMSPAASALLQSLQSEAGDDTDTAAPTQALRGAAREGLRDRAFDRTAWLAALAAGLFLVAAGGSAVWTHAMGPPPGPRAVLGGSWRAQAIESTHLRDATGRRVLVVRGDFVAKGAPASPRLEVVLLDALGRPVGRPIRAHGERLANAALTPERIKQLLEGGSSPATRDARGFTVLIPEPTPEARRFEMKLDAAAAAPAQVQGSERPGEG